MSSHWSHTWNPITRERFLLRPPPIKSRSHTHTHTKWGRLLSFSLSLFLLLLWNIYFILDVIVRWKDLIYLYIFSFFFFTYRDGGGGWSSPFRVVFYEVVLSVVLLSRILAPSSLKFVCVLPNLCIYIHIHICVCVATTKGGRGSSIIQAPAFLCVCVSHAYHIGPDYLIVYTV